MDDVQIAFSVSTAMNYFRTHHRSPWEWDLAFEGCVLIADMVLQRIRNMYMTPDGAFKLADATNAYRDWQEQVKS
jgi:hypothetical protein